VVPPEVIAAGEALAALRALEHPLPQVQHLVGLEALRAAEALAALGAAVGPHARVLPLVPLQVPRLPEAVAAVRAQVRLLPGVSPEVHVELARVREALAAVGAGVRLLARVHPLVLLEAVVVAEALPAVGAQVQHLHLPEARVGFERFAAGVALPAMRAHVRFPVLLLFLFPVFLLLLLQLIREAVGVAVRQILHRVVPLDVFYKVALHGEGELAEGAREELRRAVVPHARLALLVLLEVAGRGEDFAAAVAAVRRGVLVRHLLVSLQEAGLAEGRPALSALELLRRALVRLEVVRVPVRPLAAVAAEPFAFRPLSVGVGRRLLAGGRPSFWGDELGYGRNF